jgi:16S rRNA (uracil1498-N3)-methyltransferase
MRRVRVEQVKSGSITLAKAEAHHARDVLRLSVGVEVEVFDEHGRTGAGRIVQSDSKKVVVLVGEIREKAPAGFAWAIASAVPKGNRADWMIEKLSELGTSRFIPLAARRSVVLPEGKGKHQRWERLASEAAKQSKRVGVMAIEELTKVENLLAQLKDSTAWYLSTAAGAQPIAKVIRGVDVKKINPLTLLIGPEGGWTDEEMAMFAQAGLTPVSIATTILRVETAAVAAAAIVAGVVAPAAAESESA